jgi:hypothetical protein
MEMQDQVQRKIRKDRDVKPHKRVPQGRGYAVFLTESEGWLSHTTAKDCCHVRGVCSRHQPNDYVVSATRGPLKDVAHATGEVGQ